MHGLLPSPEMPTCAPLLHPPYSVPEPQDCVRSRQAAGTVCTFYCHQGYVVDGGVAAVQCRKDGSWDNNPMFVCVSENSTGATFPPRTSPNTGRRANLYYTSHNRARILSKILLLSLSFNLSRIVSLLRLFR